MRQAVSSIIMRTTLDIENPVLEELREFGRAEGRSLGQAASELLAEALHGRKKLAKPVGRLAWKSHPMGARLDLADKDAVFALLDRK